MAVPVYAKAQAGLDSHIVGRWTVKAPYYSGDRPKWPAQVQGRMDTVENAFLKSTFHFRKDNSFRFDIPLDGMSVKKGTWFIDPENDEIVITGLDNKGRPAPMKIHVAKTEGKTIFVIAFLAFEMIRQSAE